MKQIELKLQAHARTYRT